MRRLRSVIPALVPLLVVTAAAELAVRYSLVKSYLVPAPSSIVRAMIESRAELFDALLTTSASALVGFLLSTIAGIFDSGLSCINAAWGLVIAATVRTHTMRSTRPRSCAAIMTLRTNGERGDQCSFMACP